jgi:hypothetical protein
VRVLSVLRLSQCEIVISNDYNMMLIHAELSNEWVHIFSGYDIYIEFNNFRMRLFYNILS